MKKLLFVFCFMISALCSKAQINYDFIPLSDSIKAWQWTPDMNSWYDVWSAKAGLYMWIETNDFRVSRVNYSHSDSSPKNILFATDSGQLRRIPVGTAGKVPLSNGTTWSWAYPISLTTIGTSGVATYNSSTGVLNVPQYSAKKQETFSGTTNSSGIYTVTFGAAYSVAPNIQANIVGGTNTNLIKITSVSTTGFTVTVVNRTDVVGLLPSYTGVNAAAVDVLITEK